MRVGRTDKEKVVIQIEKLQQISKTLDTLLKIYDISTPMGRNIHEAKQNIIEAKTGLNKVITILSGKLQND